MERPAVERLQALGEREQLLELELREQAPDLVEPVAGGKLARIALQHVVQVAEAPSRRNGIRTSRIVVDPPPEGDREPVLLVRSRVDLVERGRDRCAFRGEELRQQHLFSEPAGRAQPCEGDGHTGDDGGRRKVDEHVGQIPEHDRPVDRQAVTPSCVERRRNRFHPAGR